jgi:hypothetical protein
VDSDSIGFCHFLLNSTEWKLAERQLHIKNAKNYRGITVTPTLSKIIEKILKIRENGKIHCKNLGMYLCFQR